MAEAPRTAQPVETPVLGKLRLAGRVQGVRKLNSSQGPSFRMLMRLPAPDAYSSPATVEVRSTERFAQVNEECSILVAVGGYPRSFEGKGERGEPGDTVRTAENVLTFIGHA